MTFHEELAELLKDEGLLVNAAIVPIKDEDKPTLDDYRELEKRIRQYSDENEAILVQSMINARNSVVL